MNNKIKTFDTTGFMDKYIDPKLKDEAIKADYDTFLIMPVQQML